MSSFIDEQEYTRLESEVNSFLDQYETSDHKGVGYLLRQPRRTAAALASARQLPVLRLQPSPTVEGRAVQRELSRGSGRLRTTLHAVSAAIAIPADLAEYEAGASKQTLRRKLRAAQKRGITWESVEGAEARRELVLLADEHERNNPNERYRALHPSNDDLIEYDLWMVARSSEGQPLLLAVTPVDNGVAALRYFRTLRADDDATLARYLMTWVLVGELHRRGVHHLVDTTISMHLSHGLRHFQRMVGFRLIRLEMAAD